MSRLHVICCDGTSNQFGEHNTNVVRLVRLLDPDSPHQRVFYDPGVGTLPEPSVFTSAGKRVSTLLGLAFGLGLIRNVEDAYTYLMEAWEPGDKIFLFGFSRGAYTVRVLAGLLNVIGLLSKGNEQLVPYVLRMFGYLRRAALTERGRVLKFKKLTEDFQTTFARVTGPAQQRHCVIDFMGLWDTVTSVGWVWNPVTFPYTTHLPNVRVIRHALSLDERRAFFRQNHVRPLRDGSQDLEERWFAGVHGDVGGGYRVENDRRLWEYPFAWIVEEAVLAGLSISTQRLQAMMPGGQPAAKAFVDSSHKSLRWYWWPAELVPKWHRRYGSRLPRPYFGLWRRRKLEESDRIDRSVLIRLRQTDYRPSNLSPEFVEHVQHLTHVPIYLTYHA
jgi:uncharacterized protein (DUF2235 family)